MPGQPLNTGLLERIDELARIDAALADACAGRGRFVVLEGPAGIGKTAVLAAVRESAAARGMRVLRARGTELEREFAFGVVRQLFEPPLAHASELERGELLHATAGTAAAILELPGAAPAPDDPASLRPDVSFAVLHGLYWLCANLAAAGPVCLVIDDAHWADGPSLRYLAFLLTRLEELDVALVLATRPQEARTDTELLAALAGDSGADLIRLSPLSRAAVAELVEATLVGVPDPLFVDTCLRETGGSPFLLRVLVDALREGGVSKLRGWPIWTSLTRPRQPSCWPRLGSSSRAGRWRSSTRSSAAGSTQTSPASSAHEVTAARRDCSPRSRARASASPSTCS